MTAPNRPIGRTDKWSLGYYPAYEKLAAAIGPHGRVLEVGVAYGGSLAMWQELFPEGLIVGVDNDPNAMWPKGTVKIYADQGSEDMVTQALAASAAGYDLIVDDGSHVGDLTNVTFGLLWPLVTPGGWYVIEDWTVSLVEPYASSGRFGGDAMLRLVQGFVAMLEPVRGAHDFTGQLALSPGTQVGELWYRFGQAMIRKGPVDE